MRVTAMISMARLAGVDLIYQLRYVKHKDRITDRGLLVRECADYKEARLALASHTHGTEGKQHHGHYYISIEARVDETPGSLHAAKKSSDNLDLYEKGAAEVHARVPQGKGEKSHVSHPQETVAAHAGTTF